MALNYMGIEKRNLTAEEQAVAMSERAKSDAELMRSGAEYVATENIETGKAGGPRFELTEEQIEKAKAEGERIKELEGELTRKEDEGAPGKRVESNTTSGANENTISELKRISSVASAELYDYNSLEKRQRRLGERKEASVATFLGGGAIVTGGMYLASATIVTTGLGIGLIGAPVIYGAMKFMEKRKGKKLQEEREKARRKYKEATGQR